MEKTYVVQEVGYILAERDAYCIDLHPAYIKALSGLEGFSHIQILWWFSLCDDNVSRAMLEEEKPYTRGPGTLGVFATRSPRRPNPLALTCAQVTYMDMERGRIGLAYIDAQDGSPVLDIKPYTPSLDRVKNPSVPDWCAHWPGSVEASGVFDWGAEFNF